MAAILWRASKRVCFSIEGDLAGLGTPHLGATRLGATRLGAAHLGVAHLGAAQLEIQESQKRKSVLCEVLKELRPDRILLVAEAMREGISLEEIFDLTAIDPWFLEQIKKIVDYESQILERGLPQTQEEWFLCKRLGFSDVRLARLSQRSEEEVRDLRQGLEVRPVYKTVDTCASEFESLTSSFYSCYEGHRVGLAECESQPSEYKKIIILGSGPNRIGQGIEFDYACVHASQILSEMGYETIMINCNPETVSTDDDTSDKLYFEPLSCEHVLEVIHCEKQKGELVGVVVQLGGQTPLKLAQPLKKMGIPIIGTSPDNIDLAEK